MLFRANLKGGNGQGRCGDGVEGGSEEGEPSSELDRSSKSRSNICGAIGYGRRGRAIPESYLATVATMNIDSVLSACCCYGSSKVCILFLHALHRTAVCKLPSYWCRENLGALFFFI